MHYECVQFPKIKKYKKTDRNVVRQTDGKKRMKEEMKGVGGKNIQKERVWD